MNAILLITAVIGQLTRAVPWPYPKGGVLTYIKKEIIPKQGQGKWVWGICLKDNPEELIGGIDLYREGKPEHRGFWLGKPFWGRGIMTEAVFPIMDYAFDTLHFETLIFANVAGNIRSRRIKEKTGARLIRIQPGEFVNPNYAESEIWGITKQEWRVFRQSHSGKPA